MSEQEIIDQSIKKTYGYFLLNFESYKITEKTREIYLTSFILCLYIQMTRKVQLTRKG